jgi:hypothetical protein
MIGINKSYIFDVLNNIKLFDSKKVKDFLPKKMGRFLPTRELSKIFVK